MGNLRTGVKIGGHVVTWTPDGGSPVDLGLTKEGCEIQVKKTVLERTVNELAAPFDAVVTGVEVTGKVILVEYSLDTIAAVLDALKTTVSSDVSVDLNPLAGVQCTFGKLVFHPRKLAAATVTEDKTIHNAIVIADAGLMFKANEDLTWQFSFKAGAWQDTTTGNFKLMTIGAAATAKVFAVATA